MNKTIYEYFMAESYTILLEEDIEKYGIVPLIRTHFNVHYIYDSLTFIVNDDGTNTISKKFNKDDNEKKSSLYDLPAQVTYNFKQKPVLIYYKHADTKGGPTKILLNYSVNGLLIEKKYFWYDFNDIKFYNDELNIFFNEFFLEKVFDISLDYDESDIMKELIYMYLNGEEDEIREAFKCLNINSLKSIRDSESLFEMICI